MITTLSLNACWNRTCLIQCNKQARAKTLSTNLSYLYLQTFVSFAFPYFNSNVLYSIHFFCIPCFFVVNLFSNVCIHSSVWFFQTFDDFRKHVPIKLLFSLCCHFCIEFSFSETFMVINSVTRILSIEILYNFRTVKCWSTLCLHMSGLILDLCWVRLSHPILCLEFWKIYFH